MSAGKGNGGQVGGLHLLLRANTTPFARDMMAARGQAQAAEEALERTDRSASRLRGTFSALAAGTVALTAATGALVQRYGDVDEQLARIRANTQASTDTMEAMRNKAQELGEDLPSTLQDSADTLYHLTSAGFTTDEAMGALEGTTYLAVAGQLSMQRAAKVTTSVLNAWSLEAQRANSVADLLASTSAESAAEVRGLGDSLSYSSAMASQVGATAGEISAWTGILSDSGVEGTRAGTAINNALTKMVDPTEEADKALRSIGLTTQDFYDKSGQLRDVTDIARMLKQEMGDLSAQRRSELLNQIYGIRGARAMAPLLSQTKEFSELMRKNMTAETAGAIDRIKELNDTELRSRQEAVGFALQGGSYEEVLSQFRQQYQQQGMSEEALSQQLEVGLQISPETADVLAGDIAGGAKISEVAAALDAATTSGEQADAVMSTLTGRIEQFTGSMDTFFSKVHAGAAGPLTLLLGVLNPAAKALARSETAARALGVALPVATAGLGALTASAGLYIGYQKLAVGWTWAMEGATLASAGASRAAAGAQNLLSASYWRSAGASAAATVRGKALAGARYAGRAAGYATAGAEWALTTARNSSTLAAVRARGAQMGLTASYYAGQTAAYASAAGAYALSGASTTLSGALGLAAGAASTLWAALGPLGLLALGITAIIAGDALGLPVLDGVIDSTVGKVTGLLGPLGGLEGIAATGAGALNWMAEGAGRLGSQIAGLLTPANAAKAAMLAFPGLGFAAWLFDAAGGADALRGGVDALLHPAETAQRLLGSIPGVGLVDWTGAAELGFRALTDPIGLVQDGVQWLLNKVPELPDPEDVPLLSRALDLYDKGKGAVASLAEGMRANKGEAGAAAGDVAGETDKRMPSSPAEVGPLAALDQSGPGLVRTFAQGIRANTGEAGSAASALASAAVGALPDALPSPSVAPIDAPAVAQPAAPSVPTPRTPAANVDVRADVRSLRAQVDAIAPMKLPVQLTLAGSPNLSDARNVLADVSPLSGVVSQAVRARSELEAGARSLATRIRDLSLPGGETTIGEAAGAAIETVEDTVGVELPGLPLGIEQRQQTVGQRVADRRPETLTPPGGFETMTAAVRPTEAGSIEQRVIGRSDPVAPIGPRGPQGPVGPHGPAGGAGGATAAVGAGRIAQPARPETIGTPSAPAPDAPPTLPLDPVAPESNTETSPVPVEDVDRQPTEQQQHTRRRPIEVNLEQHITFEEPPGGSGDGGPSIEEIRAMMNEAGDEILDEVSGWFTRYDDETGSNRGS